MVIKVGKGRRFSRSSTVAPPVGPTITSASAQTVAEGSAFSLTLTANQAVSWAKTGGADAALFTLAGGVLSMTAKDREAPADADANNVYLVQVTATNTTTGLSSPAQTIAVTVSNVNDTNPAAFSFTALTDVAPGTTQTSGLITISGLGAEDSVTASVSGAATSALSKNGGAYTSASVTVSNGDTLRVHHTASSTTLTAVSTTLTVGTTSATFTSTTAASSSNPASVSARTWGAEVYGLSGTTGFWGTPNKVPGVDALPSGATYSASNNAVTLGGSGGTFEGWNMTGTVLIVQKQNWIIQNNDFRWPADVPNSAGSNHTYGIIIGAANTSFWYNTCDSNYGISLQTHIHIFTTSGGDAIDALSGIQICYNKFLHPSGDSLKLGGRVSSLAGRPWVHHNYFTIGGWTDNTSTSFPHFDAITPYDGGALIERNYFALAPYVTNNNDATYYPSMPRNTSPSATRGTRGMNNFVRCQPTGTGTVMTNITIRENIVTGHARGGAGYPFQATPSSGVVALTDNVIEGNLTGDIIHPDSWASGTFSATGNTRFSDGTAYLNETAGAGGETGTVPTAPVLIAARSITTSTAALTLDLAADADSHEFQYSTNGGSTWNGTWISAGSGTDPSLTGLPAGTALTVKLRGVNGSGAGPESNTIAFTTAASTATGLVLANNSGAAYSTATSPFAETAVTHFAVLMRFVPTAIPTTTVSLWGQNTNSRCTLTTAGALQTRLTSSSHLFTSPFTLTAGQAVTILLTVDTAGASAAEKVRWYVKRGGALETPAQGSVTGFGTSFNFSTIFTALKVNAHDSTSVVNNGFQAIGFNLGTSSSPITLPAPANLAAFDALFGDEQILGTLATWDAAWGSPAADGVGASDGSEANRWNSSLPNLGTSGVKPLVKTAGTYTAG